MSLQTQHDPKNEAEITYWNSAGGRRWVERQQSQDIVLAPILQATLERAQLRQGERVVDIGCGAGASSIALARLTCRMVQAARDARFSIQLTGIRTKSPPTPISALGKRDFGRQRQRPRKGPRNPIDRLRRQNVCRNNARPRATGSLVAGREGSD
jgi:hypothetical protein